MFKKPNESHEGETASVSRGDTPVSDRFAQNQVTEHKRSVLTPSMHIKGDISGTEDLVLEGKMEGTISLPKNEVLIGPDGQVKADVTALKVSIEGRVVGDIRGSERVVIKHSGRVEGNIVAPRVVLEDGCQFKGSVEMNIGSGAPEGVAASKPQDAKGQDSKNTDSKSKTQTSGNSKVSQYSSEEKSRATSAS